MLAERPEAVTTCPKCKLGVMFRVGREGFLENNVLTKLGRFPWMCSECKARVRLKRRRVPPVVSKTMPKLT